MAPGAQSDRDRRAVSRSAASSSARSSSATAGCPAGGSASGAFAYSPDVKELPEPALAELRGVEVWLVDCLRDRPHPSHAHLEQTLAWIDQIRPRRAILTHMNHELDYAELKDRLPAGVEPAYDGMVLDDRRGLSDPVGTAAGRTLGLGASSEAIGCGHARGWRSRPA